MAHFITFSKNRAAQLHLLLESIQRFVPHTTVDVLFKATTTEFENGYERVFNSFREVDFYEEGDSFIRDVRSILSRVQSNVCSFLVDDDVFFRGVSPKDLLHAEKEVHLGYVECFSFRLGANITIQDFATQKPVAGLVVDRHEPPFLYWQHRRYGQSSNFGYPLSVDGHLFRRDRLIHWVSQMDAGNPNDFEGQLQRFMPKTHPTMMSQEHSSLVNIPCNRVNTVVPNAAGTLHSYSPEELNEKYLAGYTIDLDEVCKHEFRGCHEEIPLSFVKSEGR